MSMPRRRTGSDRSDAARILDRLLDQWWEPETPYLTDGTKLYRYAGAAVSNTAEQLIQLEDCESLELLLFDLDELRALRLRPVVDPASIESGTRRPLRQT
jgi:hypothetical protein